MDNHCSKGNCLSHTILSKHQFSCDNHLEKKKVQTLQVQKKSIQPLSSGSPYPDNNDFAEKKARKEKKKKFCLE